jgi:oxygen-independent coproporphyrinogen-3 oxidase
MPLASQSHNSSDDLIATSVQVDSAYRFFPSVPPLNTTFTKESYCYEVGREKKQSTAPLSLYVHIPFCEKLCYFCSCNKVITSDHTVVRRYLDYLTKEIRLQAELVGPYRQVVQLHLGGGTPTFFEGAELTELMYLLASHFKLNDQQGREYSIEVDPRSINKDTLPLLKGLGFNHLHFGMQDFDDKVLQAIHRDQSFDLITKLDKAVRHYQFSSISYDMVYGLPAQTIKSLGQTLDKLIALSPDRIVYYAYSHQPDLYKSQGSIDRGLVPSTERMEAMLALITKTLVAGGYQHIGLDLFVKPSDPLAVAQREGRLGRGLQGYSASGLSEMIGIGVSAGSSLNHAYAKNTSKLADYYHYLDNNELPIYEGVELNTDDEIRRDIVIKLACDHKLDTKMVEEAWTLNFTDYFSAELSRLEPMEKDGLIEWHGATLRITERGRAILSSICALFDKHYQGGC